MTRLLHFSILPLVGLLAFAGCTGEPSGQTSSRPATRSEVLLDPLPRIVDNSPGENHFDTLVQLTDGGVNRRPVFTDNDRVVAFSSQRPPHKEARVYHMFTDASGLKSVAEDLPQPLIATPSATGDLSCFTALKGDASGKAYTDNFPPAPGVSTEVVLRIGDGEPAVISKEGQIAGRPTLTPDGLYVVYCGEFSEGQYDLYVYTIASGLNEKITTTDGFDGDPSFSSDGRRLIFVSQRNDQDPEEYNLFAADWLLIQEE